MQKFKKFEEFISDLEPDLENIPKSEQISPHEDPSVISGITTLELQNLNNNEVRPFTKDEYLRYVVPHLKKYISYEDYLKLWNGDKIEDDTEKLDTISETYPQGTSGNPIYLDRLNDKSYISPIVINKLNSQPTSLNNWRKSQNELLKIKKFNINHQQDEIKEKTWWQRIHKETKIMIVIMAIGVLISFITMVVLMLK